MLTLVAGLIGAVTAPSPAARLAATCDVGRVALRDLPAFNPDRLFHTYYGTPEPGRHDLLTVCPKLSNALPAGFPLADDIARSRAGDHALGRQAFPPTSLFTIDTPLVSDDLRSATVSFRYTCTGLCGGGFEVRYIRTARGWQRDGGILTTWVS